MHKNMNMALKAYQQAIDASIITYLVSCRRSIEIWRVCKIYGRRGGAEPSIILQTRHISIDRLQLPK